MKKLVREYEFDEEGLQKVRALARELSLTETVVKLLCARGVDTAEKIRAFLSPSESHFLSPYLMSGMQEAVGLIRRAQEEGWNVAVFGDYDADGICAASVMYYALSALGIEPHVFIPERSDGYGLSIQAVDKIFDECIPDLFITVDCGISNRREVEYVKEQGAYVIVTDHHELPEELPDCVCVNPKLRDDYPYDNLCGAGVAFKLACALLGKEAYGLLDFAALATVADSVPLLGENRDIVYEGLKRISGQPRPAFAALLGKQQGEITAQTLAFTVAPRINAAGRMGDAASALRLFLSSSPSEIYDLAVKLNEYNLQRQRCCDELYESAKAKIRKKGAYGSVIMLSDEGWSSGFVGIVAARIAEEYCRPTLLFVRNGDMLKGSARSIESVNVFDALRHCGEYIEEFGGHAQAAGINVRAENFEKLERALDGYIGRTYAPEDFVPKLYVSEEITSEFSLQLAHELNALEPYGVGHKKPLFYLTARNLSARPVKNRSPHLLIKTDYIDLMYFNGAKYTRLIESDVEKQFVFECNCSVFRGRESVKGFVRDILYDGNSGEISLWRFSAALGRLRGEGPAFDAASVQYLSRAALDDLIRKKRAESAYGLCLVASDPRTVRAYESVRDMVPDLIYPSARNVANVLILSPAADADFSDYRDIVFLDRPFDFNLTGLSGKNCYAARDTFGSGEFLHLDATREGLLAVFAALRAHAGELRGSSVEETAVLGGGLGFSLEECMFALSVFEELGLIDYETGRIVVYRGIHADLNDSPLYRRVTALQNAAK